MKISNMSITMKNILKLALIIIILSSCANKKDKGDPLANLSSAQLYESASQDIDAGKYKQALEYLEKINQEFPYAKEAQKAQYMEGFLNYKLKKYELALVSFDEYIDLYPAGEDIENAYYIKSMCYYDQIVNTSLDQEFSGKALEEFKIYLARFPSGLYAQDISLKLDLVYDQLSGHEMVIGRYYQKQKILNGAINRFLNVVENYQTTVFIEEALYRLVECYLTLGLSSEAEKYASILGTNYNDGEWYKKAYDLLMSEKKK